MLHPILFLCLAAAIPTGALSENEAVKRALAVNPDLAASRVKVEAVRIAPSALRSPELRLAAYDDAADTTLPDLRRNNVGLHWTPPRLGELGLPSTIARARASEAEAQVAAEENRLAAEIRLLHRTIRLMDEQIRVADENIALCLRIVEAVAEQVTAGVRTALDRSRAELDLAAARSSANRFRSERRLRLLRLCQKTNVPFSDGLVLTGPDDVLQFKAPAERIETGRAAAGRSEITSAVAGIRVAELRLASSRRDRYPWFSLVQVTRQSHPTEVAPRWGFQVGIDLGLFRWRSSETKAASLDLRHSQLRESAVRSSVAAEVDEIVLRLESAARELAGNAAETEALARRHLEIANAQLASGQSDKVEPLAAELRLLAARQDWLAKLMECHALAVGLDQAAGRSARDLSF